MTNTKRIAIAAVVIALVFLSSVSLIYTSSGPAQRVPFVGMILVYAGHGSRAPEDIFRTVTVLFYDAAANTVIVDDSYKDWLGTMEIDLATRELLWWTGSYTPTPPSTLYAEYWIPTNIGIGSHVSILTWDAVVADSMTLSLNGKPIQVWQLQASFIDDIQTIQTVWYYEKLTGIWVGASFVWLDDTEGYGICGQRVCMFAGLTLTSTNVFP